MSTKTACLLFGAAFLAVGILGYFPNPIISETGDAVFHTDSLHNIIHIVSGILFFLVALALPAYAKTFLIIFGIVYLLLGIYGAATIGDEEHVRLLGFLLVNEADNYLHIGLGLAILLSAFSRGNLATPVRTR
jgi:hypothetical membrane protein